MSEKSEAETLSQLTLFAGGSPASRIVLPGSAEARQMTVISGRKCAALLQNSSPVGCLLKMCLASEQPYSTRRYLIWKISATPQGRSIYQLAPSMPRIPEKEYLLLPTPRAIYGAHPGMNDPRHLTGAVKMFPTPTDPSKGGGSSRSHDRQDETPSLQGMARKGMLPTPNSTQYYMTNSTTYKTPTLIGMAGGQLNPEFVEWLMGFPIGWTDLEASEMP